MTEPAPSAADTPGAILFDVDGTLVDTVYQHVVAWWEAFAERGHAVSCFDIHRAIGGREPVAAIVSSAPVERSKPDQQIVRKAVTAAGVSPVRCVMIGDTVYDVRAALAAGVRPLGVMCGGIGRQELVDAGAAAVYGNPSELLDAIEEWAPLG